MKVLGLDISSACTGWAVIEDGILKEYGAIPIKRYKKQNKISNEMIWKYASKLKRLVIAHDPDVVGVENVYVDEKNFRVGLMLSSMVGIARAIGYGHTLKDLPTIFPSQVNSLFKIGNPIRAERKPLIVKHTNAKWKLNLRLKDDDIADAICIAHISYLSTQGKAKVRYI